MNEIKLTPESVQCIAKNIHSETLDEIKKGLQHIANTPNDGIMDAMGNFQMLTIRYILTFQYWFNGKYWHGVLSVRDTRIPNSCSFFFAIVGALAEIKEY